MIVTAAHPFLQYFRSVAPVRYALKAAYCLLEEPFDNTRIVVAEAHNMVERREAVRLAGLLHLVKLRFVKLVVLDGSPVVARRVHGEAWSQGSVGPDDAGVLARTAVPLLKLPAHELFHLGQARG